MDLAITQVPVWLSILFIISFSTIPVFLINQAVKFAYENYKTSSLLRKRIVIFYWLYFGIVAVLSLTGFFMKNVLPPRIILVTVIPLFLFYILYVQRTKWFAIVFKHIKLEQLVFIHVFRFVGVFFFLVYFYDVIPKEFACIGGAGDILTAVLVFPVVRALKKRYSYAKLVTWVWNIIGVIDIVSVLVTAIVLTKVAVQNNTEGVSQFGTFPFSWIPAFAPATIIFLHILVFKKLKEE
ncbi:hypothetical protein CLV91_3251 [Maribacter vaceletii]|uniref:Uncharacterized protein n=1 Tax=Maribacter vaceletii TaxID=1206816 RepID=A0A495DV90_9FLAO|nr:hypothetical protein [Maribacter vaceletii]RKR07021.1 hypothetical protein CLV91_3251 [Maribacter vaceletii]